MVNPGEYIVLWFVIIINSKNKVVMLCVNMAASCVGGAAEAVGCAVRASADTQAPQVG